MELKKVINILKKDEIVHSIILFGSYLNNKNYNDIDVCIIPNKKISLRKKIKLQRELPEKIDLNFLYDLPIQIRFEVLSKGKILFTKDYYKVLETLKITETEFNRFKIFFKDYHKEMMIDG